MTSITALIDRDRAVTIGLLTNELVTNAFKHGYGPGEEGRILIRAGRDAEGTRFEVVDDGRGLPRGYDPERAETRIATRETRGIGVSRAGELAVGSLARLVAYRYPDAFLRVIVKRHPELDADLAVLHA